MVNQTCDCRGSTAEQASERTASYDRWLAERPVTSAPLPQGVGERMGQFFGEEPVETLADFVAVVRDATDGGSISVDDLCHVAAETSHRATVKGETYHFRCFYDGIALAHLVDESVEIRTESPTAELVTMQASPDGDLNVTPSDAAMSFGIATGEDAPVLNGPLREAVYEAICLSVKAFSSREAYEGWAESVDAATVGMPLAAGVPVAAALTE